MVVEWDLPIALAAALLLGGGWVGVGVAGFAEVAREVLFRGGGAVGKADVVAVGGFVGASHCAARVRSMAAKRWMSRVGKGGMMGRHWDDLLVAVSCVCCKVCVVRSVAGWRSCCR